MTKSKNVRELLCYAEKSMTDIETARLDAELLLANSMHTERTSLYAYPGKIVPEDVANNFYSLLNKRKQHYPVAYLTGSKEFWSLHLKVNHHTLVPRPETECLVERALEIIPGGQAWNILDMGTGSGAIALAIASERPACRLVAVDTDEKALAVASTNAEKLGINNVEFLKSDWFSKVDKERFEIIISNPPYVETSDRGFSCGEIQHEPRLALDGGNDGMQSIARLIPGAINFLKPPGYLLLEHGHTQAHRTRELFVTNQYKNIMTGQDYAGLDRLSFAQRS